VTLNLSIITATFPGFLSYPSVYLSLLLSRNGKEGTLGKEVAIITVLFIIAKDFTKKNYSFVVFIAINTTRRVVNSLKPII